MDQHYLFEARQMQALSLSVHIPLVCFGIAFPALVLFAEWRYLRTGDPVYRTLAQRWSKIMLALFAVGMVTGTILSFELGLLWPVWMQDFGNVFGLGFTLEGFSFFVEAWTCYPVAFGSIVSTLSIPLFIAAVGIIFRGTTYALRSQLERGEGRGVRAVENVFALSSVLTPFALATVIGAIATGRVPVGNARGNLVTSWLNPVSILAGVLAVAFSGYLAAVYLAADARRLAERSLVRDFRIRGLAAGVGLADLRPSRLGARRRRADAGGLRGHGVRDGRGLVRVIMRSGRDRIEIYLS
ncbi:MAG: cytochrome ubiquinol oxidase subunit I [Streptosporangiaceae bacterium]